MSFTSSQPEPVAPMARESLPKRLINSVRGRDAWVGDYDFKYLCMPSFPYGKKVARRPPPFYGLDDKLPWLLAIIAGFQHSLAMLAGVITPPIIMSSMLGFDPATRTYMVSASLITSGLLSAVQMSRIPLFRGYKLGNGLLNVVGTSFASLSTAGAIFNALYADGTCTMRTLADGTTVRNACPDAYGYLLGTTALCSLLEIALSFVPPKKLKAIFPPIVTGTVVILVGASLIGKSGMLNWGGGSNDCHFRPETGLFRLCPNINAPKAYAWGDARFLGLGFLSFITIVIVEIFGSPFLRNASIIMGLLVGMIVAGAAGYVDPSSITSAPAVTFLWVKTFKLRIYGPAILPSMAVYVALALEAIGDITASSEASRVDVVGPDFDSRIQGGVLADGVAGLLSSLMTTTPVSIYAQNNGVIVLTRCANRRAGYICCCFMVLYGIFGKLSGVFLAIPNSVLGGVTTFLFASVMASGIKVISMIKFTRKDRFVLAAALSLGVGNLLVPEWSTYLFAGVSNPSKGLSGFFNSIIIILSTPFLIAGLVATLLVQIIPDDAPDVDSVVETNMDDRIETVELGREDAGPSRSRSEDEKMDTVTRVHPVA